MTIFDPLRKKEVAATVEEQVRQWFITQLNTASGVPLHMMMSEHGFRFGEKVYRADIIIYGRDGAPMAIVECKRPDVEITASVAEQALRYDAVLSVKYIFLTNGKKTYVYRRGEDKFETCQTFPSWEEMLNGSH